MTRQWRARANAGCAGGFSFAAVAALLSSAPMAVLPLVNVQRAGWTDLDGEIMKAQTFSQNMKRNEARAALTCRRSRSVAGRLAQRQSLHAHAVPVLAEIKGELVQAARSTLEDWFAHEVLRSVHAGTCACASNKESASLPCCQDTRY